MSTVWLVEARRHLGPFAAAITVGGLLGAARLLFTPVTFDVFFQLFSMLAWTVLAGYAFSVVYGYFFLGRDVFLHLGHRSPARATALKMAVQIAYLFMLFCWLLVFNALWMAHVGTDEMPVVLTYYVTARVASLACFAAVVLAIIAVVKRIHGKTVALISALVMYAVVTGGHAYLMWWMTHRGDTTWALGIASDFPVVNQYANILPMMIGSPTGTYADSVSPTSIALNVAVAVLGCGVWIAMTRRARLNFYRR
ncbi:MAG TPA: hypothetical protein VNC23_12315 [Lapillicoccus sp.]|nr:hypothetical protein [Lapillicoccus sp.]